MAIITMPRTLRCAAGCKIEQATTDSLGVSDPGGNSQARFYGHPRWALSLMPPPHLADAHAGVWKAMLLRLRGSVNYLSAYDPARRVPVGTLRGTPTLLADVDYGDTAAVLDCTAGQAGRTVKVGDWLQLGAGFGTSQLVMCMADATVDGAGHLALAFEAPARMDFAAGTAVAWDHPVSYFRKPPGRVGWAAYSTRHTQVMGIDLLEAW